MSVIRVIFRGIIKSHCVKEGSNNQSNICSRIHYLNIVESKFDHQYATAVVVSNYDTFISCLQTLILMFFML